MTLGTFNRCCICIDLRMGSFIIAYLLSISRVIQFILSCVHLSGLNTALSKYTNHNLILMHEDLVFSKLILSLEILLLTFELLISFALLNGLHKKIQDQVQMFYVGGFIFEVLRLIIVTVVMMRYAAFMRKLYGPWQWTILAFDMIGHLLYFYFLSVIRSYYFRMQLEARAQRWSVFSNSLIQLKVNK